MKIGTATALLAVLLTTSTIASAQSGAEIGTLVCTLTDVDNLIVYSKEEFACEFKPNSADPEGYQGVIKSVGVDLQIKKDATLIWAVIAPTDVAYAPGSLRGTYVGGSTEVSLVGGVGAKVLVGGGENSFTLQPVSVEGIVGVGASIGIQNFELK